MNIFLRNSRNIIVRNYHRHSEKILAAKINRDNVSVKYTESLEKFKEKILFNSLLEVQKLRLRKLDEMTTKEEKQRIRKEREFGVEPVPLVLSQLCEDIPNEVKLEEEEKVIEQIVQSKRNVVFPYSRYLKVERSKENSDSKEIPDEHEKEEKKIPKNWLQDYEYYDEAEDELDSKYGTPDPNYPITEVPCGGCGALLHCKKYKKIYKTCL